MIGSRLVLALILVLPVRAHAEIISLRDALAESLDRNPRVREQIKNYNAAVQDMRVAATGFNPTVSIEYDEGYNNHRGLITGYRNRGRAVQVGVVAARQLVFDGGRVRNDRRSREMFARSALLDYVQEANQLGADCVEAYVSVQKFHRLQILAGESVAIHRRLMDNIKLRVEAGKDGQSDLERVVGRYAGTEATYVARSADYKRAVYAFHRVLGRFAAVEDTEQPEFDESKLPPDLTAAFYRTMDNNPTLLQAEVTISQRKYEYKREKAEYLPLVTLEAERDLRFNFNGIEGPEDDERVLFRVQHKLFDGGVRRLRSARAVSLVNRDKEALDRIKRNVIADLQLAWITYKAFDGQISALRKSLLFTRKALQAYKEEFTIGRRLLINVLDAELEYQNARAQLASNEFDLLIQKYRVLAAMGTIVVDTGLEVPYAQQLKRYKRPHVATKDLLALNPDVDRDRVLDRKDISTGSVPESKVATIGEAEDKADAFLKEPAEPPQLVAVIRSAEELKKALIRLDVDTRLLPVAFSEGTAELTPGSEKFLKAVLEQIRSLAAEGAVQVTVTMASSGSFEAEYRLAILRAYAIKKFFTRQNLDRDGIQTFAEPQSGPSGLVSLKVLANRKGYTRGYDTRPLDSIRFDEDDLDLPEAAQPAIATLAAEVRRLGGPPLDVIVYSNDDEEEADNEKLSQGRAESIRLALGAAGLPVGRIVPVGWGPIGPAYGLPAPAPVPDEAPPVERIPVERHRVRRFSLKSVPPVTPTSYLPRELAMRTLEQAVALETPADPPAKRAKAPRKPAAEAARPAVPADETEEPKNRVEVLIRTR